MTIPWRDQLRLLVSFRRRREPQRQADYRWLVEVLTFGEIVPHQDMDAILADAGRTVGDLVVDLLLEEWKQQQRSPSRPTAQRPSRHPPLDNSPLLPLLDRLLGDQPSWEGTATELLAGLEQLADDATRHGKDWPRSPRELAGDLRRLAPHLRKTARLEVEFFRRGRDRTRIIMLTRSAAAAPPGASEQATTDQSA
ncbi:MAG TPA: hypothetical protein VNK04_03985 [Gemmataceae bacterium]|nr:hypothetical protein [Gemmataceae bacterium]